MTSLRDVLAHAATRAAAHREEAAERPVFPGDVDIDAMRTALGSLRDQPAPALSVVDELADIVGPALVATTGPRYFGFVIGGAVDAATAADVLTSGWDQPAFNAVTSPAAAVVEDVAGCWLKELLGLPSGASFGFVTGGQGANTVWLAAARHHVLAAAGWDVERDGLCGGPRVRVVATGERHATIDRAPAAAGNAQAGTRSAAVEGAPGHHRCRRRGPLARRGGLGLRGSAGRTYFRILGSGVSHWPGGIAWISTQLEGRNIDLTRLDQH